MKKRWLAAGFIFLGCLALICFGVFQKKKNEQRRSGLAGKWDALILQDHLNNPMATIWTEKGYYYYDERGLRYYDIATDSEMFLCSKPQCRHDGGSFCVATNSRYELFQYCIYGNSLYALAVDESEGQRQCKLLAYALDGSDMKEVATLVTLPRSKTVGFDVKGGNNRLLLHRNRALISIGIVRYGETEEENQYSSGSMVVDLETKEITLLEEDPLDTENLPIDNVQAYGDFLYYTVKRNGTEERPVWIDLYEYDINQKTVQKQKLAEDFCGLYILLDEDTIGYCRNTRKHLYCYSRETEESEKKLDFYRSRRNSVMDKQFHAYSSYYYAAVDIRTDGRYIYVSEDRKEEYISGGKTKLLSEQYLNIYDMRFQEVTSVNFKTICQKLAATDANYKYDFFDPRRIAFCEGEIYFYPMAETAYSHVQILGSTLYKIKLSNLLAEPQVFSAETVGKASVAVYQEIRN